MERLTRFLKTPNVIAQHDPVVQPIYQSSIFRMPSHRVAAATEHLVHPSAYYSRWGNPTLSYLENQLSTLLDCEATLVFPSGMSAITCTLTTLLAPGDLVVAAKSLYGDTTRFFLEELRRWGLRVALFDASRPTTLPQLLAEGAKAVYYESISNPELHIADFDAIRAACLDTGAVTICDCTFSPPGVLGASVRPADLCIHSLTKYMSGHYAVFGGSVSGSAPLIEKLWHKQSLYGAVLDPQAAWSISQGLKTLALRVQKQSSSAQMLAHELSKHPAVAQVSHPSLNTAARAPELSRRYLATGGAVIAMTLHGAESAATRLVEGTKVFGLSVSLGGIVSCIEHAESMSHSMLGAMDSGVLNSFGSARPPAGLIRLSVGIEEPIDLLNDLLAVLNSDDAAAAAGG